MDSPRIEQRCIDIRIFILESITVIQILNFRHKIVIPCVFSFPKDFTRCLMIPVKTTDILQGMSHMPAAIVRARILARWFHAQPR
jgi:hypothetical protein